MQDPKTETNYGHEAEVLMIGNRYYYTTQNNRVQTAWSIQGAKLYRVGALKQAQEFLEFIQKRKKNHSISIVKIGRLNYENISFSNKM